MKVRHSRTSGRLVGTAVPVQTATPRDAKHTANRVIGHGQLKDVSHLTQGSFPERTGELVWGQYKETSPQPSWRKGTHMQRPLEVCAA